MREELSTAELEEVEKDRARLCLERGTEVSFDEARADWLAHHAQRWREQQHAEMLAKEREEILKHKWIESEKARRDLGAEAALDWIRKYAAQWRKWYEDECKNTGT